MAGDPDFANSLTLLRGLADAGADLIELGFPFSDPVADGAVIQAAHLRARAAGQTLPRTLALVAALRETDPATPLVLMGYLNPVMQYGLAAFMADAARSGVDGLLLVDLPAEHIEPYRHLAQASHLHLIVQTAPTSDDERLGRILPAASGFVYHVALTGTTGAAACCPAEAQAQLHRVRAQTDLPLAIGFGIRTTEQARALAGHAELIVLGSLFVDAQAQGGATAALAQVGRFAQALR
jgi:tryptophan synthase alpha chain